MNECNICEVPKPVEEIQPTTKQRVAIIKTLKKSPIELLPQVIQNMIYEYAADTNPKDNFIRVFPEIMSLAMNYEGGFRNALSAKVKFYKDGYMIRYKDEDGMAENMAAIGYTNYIPNGDTARVTEFATDEDLHEYLLKHSNKRWIYRTKFPQIDLVTAMTYGYHNNIYDRAIISTDTRKKHKLVLYGDHNLMYNDDIEAI
jgi:hypothetical protein